LKGGHFDEIINIQSVVTD